MTHIELNVFMRICVCVSRVPQKRLNYKFDSICFDCMYSSNHLILIDTERRQDHEAISDISQNLSQSLNDCLS